MNLNDIYKHKSSKKLIQIECFATKIGKEYNSDTMVIVFRNIISTGYEKGSSCISFNNYGTQSEIESEYELFIPMEELRNYEDWDEIFELLQGGY